jgi:hypothetical protein
MMPDCEGHIRHLSPLSPQELRVARARLAGEMLALMQKDLDPSVPHEVTTCLSTARYAVERLQVVIAEETEAEEITTDAVD